MHLIAVYQNMSKENLFEKLYNRGCIKDVMQLFLNSPK